ncbi:MAG: hypothetical protein ACM3PC_06345 [Deltaproteobacteria bacterium]
MSTEKQGKSPRQEPRAEDRVRLVEMVKTPLGFFVLAMLVAEGVCGALALGTSGTTQAWVVGGFFAAFFALVAVVAFLAFNRPGQLMGRDETAEKIRSFCRRLQGGWWEVLIPAQPSAVSSVEIDADAEALTVRVSGRAYGLDGALVDVWESTAAAVNANERKLYYQWKGRRLADPNRQYEGFGEMTFSAGLDSGEGTFFDTDASDWSRACRKSTLLSRASADETRRVRNGDAPAVAELVRRRVAGAGGVPAAAPRQESRKPAAGA